MLPQEDVDKLMDDAERGANAVVTVDLENQVITGPDGGSIAFEVDAFRKHCLLNGLDDIGLTMEKADAIDAFEAELQARQPWQAALIPSRAVALHSPIPSRTEALPCVPLRA